MGKTTALVSIFVIILILVATTSARPANSLALSRQKRQSDQRLAELETLLALQKYGRHRFRMDRKKGVGADGEHPPGYGIIDFRMLGRKKKSTRFSPGELENSVKEMSLVAAVDRSKRLQEKQLNPVWTLENINMNDNANEDADSENRQLLGEQIPATDQHGDIDQRGAVPIFYLPNKK